MLTKKPPDATRTTLPLSFDVYLCVYLSMLTIPGFEREWLVVRGRVGRMCFSWLIINYRCYGFNFVVED